MIGAGVFALVHVLSPRFHFLRDAAQHLALLAGGVSVAYVFVWKDRTLAIPPRPR